jgi:hypothetical protein
MLCAAPFVALAALAAASYACSSSPPACYDGEYVACACDGGPQGYAICKDEAYGACDCSGKIPGTDAAGGDGTTKPPIVCDAKCPFAAPCTKNEDCASNLCNNYDKLGQRCTVACKQASDCPPESNKCGGKGVCQIPQ